MSTVRSGSWSCAGAIACARWPHDGPASVTTAATSAPGSAQITFLGRATDGSEVRITEQLSELALSQDSPISPAVAAGPGRAFLSFYAPGGTSDGPAPPSTGSTVSRPPPCTWCSRTERSSRRRQPISGQPVARDLRLPRAFLHEDRDSRGRPRLLRRQRVPERAGRGGIATRITFQPATALLVVPAPANPTPPQNDPDNDRPAPVTKAKSSKVAPSTGKRGLFNIPLDVGAGTGTGVVLLVILIPIWRRRAYERQTQRAA